MRWWVGQDGAGHFVKMVHNGIEYGDMQLICEAYNLMKNVLGMDADEMHEVFTEWNKGELDSYLIEITRDILAYKDEDGSPIVEKILAGQHKGQNLSDEAGYYTGYCQCNCKKCREGKRHCQGLVCRGD